MASTTLAEQLNKLKTPQTSLLLQDKYKPSLLFDTKEASKLDKDAVYKIGVSGLNELIKFNEQFEEFSKTLFSIASIGFERSVQDRKTNSKLNSDIERFLVLISPHFILNSAHKALEWLIHRFHIHDFNKDHFIMMILPHHDRRIFVRALQIINLSDPADKWGWLRPLKKTRTPLPFASLVHEVSTNNGLLKQICEYVIFATMTYGEKADNLRTMYSFFTSVIIMTVDRSDITDVQFNHILPALVKGLGSQVSDFAASSYMILSKLITKVTIRDETMDLLILKGIKKVHPDLHKEIVLLMLHLYNNPFNCLSRVSETLMVKLSKKTWFVETIVEVKNLGVNIIDFMNTFLETAFNYIAKSSGDEEESGLELVTRIKSVVEDIFDKINFDDKEILSILENTLSEDVVSMKNAKVTRDFFDKIYKSIEIRYPKAFDKFLQDKMNPEESSAQSRNILRFFISWYSKADDSLDVFIGLNHNIPEKRLMAIQHLGKKNPEIPDNLSDIVKNSLMARLNDDDDRVVNAVINLPISLLQSTFDIDILKTQLIVLLSKCHIKERKFLVKPALKVLIHLCVEKQDEKQDTFVFLVVLPYLFPIKEEDVDISLEILKSDLAKKNPYLKAVAEEVKSTPSSETLRTAAFHYILRSELLPSASNILLAIKEELYEPDAASVFFNMITLGSVCRVPSESLSDQTAIKAIEMAEEMVKKYPNIKPLKNATQINAENLDAAIIYLEKGYVPLQVITYVLEQVHRRLKSDYYKNYSFDFEDDSNCSQLVLRIVEIVFDAMIPRHRSNHAEFVAHYEWYLSIFFEIHFKDVIERVRFLSQLFISPMKIQTSLCSMKYCLKFLDDCDSYQWAFSDNILMTHLLLVLGSEHEQCRESAMTLLKKLSQTFNIAMEGFSVLISELINRKVEITMDPEQLPLVLYTLLSPDPDVIDNLRPSIQKKMQTIREIFINEVLNKEVPMHIRAQLLETLTYVNGPAILEKLVPLGSELLEQKDLEKKSWSQLALKNIIQRFDNTTVESLKNSKVFDFFLKCISDDKTQISAKNVSLFVSVIAMKQIDEVFFDKLGEISPSVQKEILSKLIDVFIDCNAAPIINAITKSVKKIRIDAQFVVDELKIMLTPDENESQAANSTLKKRRSLARMRYQFDSKVVETKKWKRGITLMEFVQFSQKNMENKQLLAPVLFDVLKTTLCFDEQSPVEYINQLVLSTIHHLAVESIHFENPDAKVDIISQCIRTSQNPQTHHHALLVLVELIKLANVRVALQNLMPIFTFMGSTVLRQDDAYSIQVICKTIDTVVPIISSSNNTSHICELLRLFITSLPDIPEHRRDPLFTKLLFLLEDHLHLYYLLTFENNVYSKKTSQSSTSEPDSERMDFALTISHKFPVDKIMDVAVKLMQFATKLPAEVDDKDKSKCNAAVKHIIDMKNTTAKQLRHYKYTLVQFLAKLLSNTEFVNRIAELPEEEMLQLNPYYDDIIVELVICIKTTSKHAHLNRDKPNGKYWKVLLNGFYDVLDQVNYLLPNDMFTTSIASLINHESLVVKHKIFDLLNARLVQKKFNEDDYDSLVYLMQPIKAVFEENQKSPSPEMEHIQQTALISLKLLAKLLAGKHPEDFKSVLELTTNLVKKREGGVRASAVLCLAELCSSMRVHAIQALNKFMPALIKLLNAYPHVEVPDATTVNLVYALQKIVESIGNFLSMYLDQLLSGLSKLSNFYARSEHAKSAMLITRLRATTQKLSSSTPLRVLLPAAEKTYNKMLEAKNYQHVPALMTILAESFGSVKNTELSHAVPDLTNFFLKVLQFREEVTVNDSDMDVDGEVTLADVTCVEKSASQAVVALVLKLSEATFRPLYYRLYDWAARNPQFKQRNITFYRLSANIAESLKSLFVLFAGAIVKHVSNLLTANNVLTSSEEKSEATLDDEASQMELIQEILLTLRRVFTYDGHDFVNQERFDILMQPIVDQIENTLGSREQYEARMKEYLVPCIAAFANATPDDSLHKQLTYQILLKTRNTNPLVRNTALNAMVEILKKLEEDFLPLLPETVPFLAELLEDEDETIEKNAAEAVRVFEEVLKEDLQKYFEKH
ncbi:HEAT repeat-containing protein 1 [Trichogramma pretiosum]|uniref:HEAT repeat-containing protein 1 n=1 Tax=Trichogramma pretiosum TaxID=7493 RepID=UPI0006C9527F|nr:HEAT repeat-containing protein 1 [Trichogramma pretiosum]